MASLTDKLKELIGYKTWQDLLEDSRDYLVAQGSSLTNFNEGGVLRTTFTVTSKLIGELHMLLLDVIKQGYVETATGFWLDLRAADQSLLRHEATAAEGEVTFSREDAAGALIVPAGTLVATKLDSAGERRTYTTMTDYTMPDGEAEADVAVRAMGTGIAFNAAAGVIEEILTPVVGLDAVTNGPDWLTSEGTDEETDDALRERCLLRWAELSRGATADAYRSWARAVSGVAGVSVDDQHPHGPGTVDVVITGSAGIPSETLLQEVQAYIDARRPQCADVDVIAPEAVEQDLDVTVRVRPGTDLSTTEADAEAILAAYSVADEDLDITPLGPGDDFVQAQVSAKLIALQDAVDVLWTSPPGNVAVASGQLFVPASVSVTVEEWEDE